MSHLHQYLLRLTGGRCSLLFELNPRNGVLQATSGFALEELRADPWIPADTERSLVDEVFSGDAPMLVTDTERLTPDLGSRLGEPAALLIPLSSGGQRAGLLAVGLASAPVTAPATADTPEVAAAFLLAIEVFRLRQRQEVQRDLRDVLDDFAGRLSATLDLERALDAVCEAATRLFGADRTSVWVHDRRAAQLLLRASSDRTHVARGLRLRTDDLAAAPAVAMRRVRAEIMPSDESATATALVPLRGTRRALGALVLDGIRIEPGSELDVLDRAEELGRQLSSAIESVQLLDDIMRSRRELEDVFDAMPYLMVVTDRRGRITHANRTFAARVSATRERVLDRPLTEFIGPELASWLTARATGPQSGRRPAATTEVIDAMLQGPFIVTATDRLDARGEWLGLVIVARDLTPDGRLDAEREELRQQLTQSEKFTALGQFIAGVAHELNNPLQGVLGHLELLHATGHVPPQLRRQLRVISREADRAAKIVRNLLVFTGSGRVKRRTVNVNAVLQRVVSARLAALRAESIEVVRHYDQKLPRVQSDPVLLHQVFLNVVMNAEQAIAATRRPGRIEMTTAVSPNGSGVVVTVRDTGPGIRPEVLPRIFEPFYTTKDVGQGTGLGLAIVYGIVQEDGGQIHAANHPEGGAVFTIELPTSGADGHGRQ